MKLYEYEARDIFQNYNIPMEKAIYVENIDQLIENIDKINPPYVLKAQVLVASRGKLGGIKFASTKKEAIDKARGLFKRRIRGLKVKGLLLAERVSIDRELYLGYVIDRATRKIILISSPEGGVDIEELAKKDPTKVMSIPVNPIIGVKDYIIRRTIKHLRIKKELAGSLKSIIYKMYQIMLDYHCELIEINPLVISNNKILAIDRKMIIDDSAVKIYKHLNKYLEERKKEMSKEELEAFLHGFSYVGLDGDIAIVGNGAGLTMATMDAIMEFGGKPACFLDIGGGATSERVSKAIKLLLNKQGIKAIAMNILGGITRCDEVAKGIIDAIKEGPYKPIIIRLSGTEEDKGREILSQSKIIVASSLDDLAQKAVYMVKSSGHPNR